MLSTTKTLQDLLQKTRRYVALVNNRLTMTRKLTYDQLKHVINDQALAYEIIQARYGTVIPPRVIDLSRLGFPVEIARTDGTKTRLSAIIDLTERASRKPVLDLYYVDSIGYEMSETGIPIRVHLYASTDHAVVYPPDEAIRLISGYLDKIYETRAKGLLSQDFLTLPKIISESIREPELVILPEKLFLVSGANMYTLRFKSPIHVIRRGHGKGVELYDIELRGGEYGVLLEPYTEDKGILGLKYPKWFKLRLRAEEYTCRELEFLSRNFLAPSISAYTRLLDRVYIYGERGSGKTLIVLSTIAGSKTIYFRYSRRDRSLVLEDPEKYKSTIDKEKIEKYLSRPLGLEEVKKLLGELGEENVRVVIDDIHYMIEDNPKFAREILRMVLALPKLVLVSDVHINLYLIKLGLNEDAYIVDRSFGHFYVEHIPYRLDVIRMLNYYYPGKSPLAMLIDLDRYYHGETPRELIMIMEGIREAKSFTLSPALY